MEEDLLLDSKTKKIFVRITLHSHQTRIWEVSVWTTPKSQVCISKIYKVINKLVKEAPMEAQEIRKLYLNFRISTTRAKAIRCLMTTNSEQWIT